MLVVVLTTVSLIALGICACAKATQIYMRRLDLDLPTVLFWLGFVELRERPVVAKRPRRTRTRSPHRRRMRSAVQRRPVESAPS